MAAQWTAETPIFLGDHWGTEEEGRQWYQRSLEIEARYQEFLAALKCRPGQDPLAKLDQVLNDLKVTRLKVRQLEESQQPNEDLPGSDQAQS